MKHFIKENWFKIGALILLLVAACAVSYYYLVFKPEQDQAAALQQMVAAQETATAQSQANDLERLKLSKHRRRLPPKNNS